MVRLKGFFIFVDGKELSAEEFRTRCIVPLCGTRNSHKVLQDIVCQVAACNESKIARKRIEYVDELGLRYINYICYGVHLLLQCNYYDNICDIVVVECEKGTSHPP